MKKRCIIISGGQYDFDVEVKENDYIIACDGGYKHAMQANIKPDLLIGDFDSYTGIIPVTIKTIQLPCEKNDTDTMFAIRHAINLGYKEMVLVCALGGRLDHCYANLQAGLFATNNGVKISLHAKDTQIDWLSNGSLSLKVKTQHSLSVFSVTDACEGVSIQGTKYEVNEMTLSNGAPIGVSNEWKDEYANISVKKGVLMIIQSRIVE